MSTTTTFEGLEYVQNELKQAGYYKGTIDGKFFNQSKLALSTALSDAAKGRTQSPTAQKHLSLEDIKRAAQKHNVATSRVRAVIKVESGGAWFTDIRKDILDLDGPGGFIDGDLMKILFEAHLFSRQTKGIYDKTHPNISSPKWNRALYVGGQGEYARLWKAMQLNESAALKSASWGMFQILGQNHKVCGYNSVQDFVNTLKQGESYQLDAFFAFCMNTMHKGKSLLEWLRVGRFDMFAEGYNGPAYAVNKYDTKLADADKLYASLKD